MRTTKVVFIIITVVLGWAVGFFTAMGIFQFVGPASEPRIEFGATVLEGDRELVKCEFDEPITVIISVMHYYDNYDELNKDHLEFTGDHSQVWGWSNCEWQPEKNAALCDIYTIMPKYVSDDPAMDTIGHEQTHGSCGDFHE